MALWMKPYQTLFQLRQFRSPQRFLHEAGASSRFGNAASIYELWFYFYMWDLLKLGFFFQVTV